MDFSAAGCPLHTRTLSVALTHAEPPCIEFSGYVLDLRKRGFAPVGGDLQGTGIIHHMLVEGTIDVEALVVRTIASRMQAVAFEPRPATGGESCRDVAGQASRLAGLPLDDHWARGVGTEIGGPRGCSHILTLVQLLGPTVRRALAEDQAAHGGTRPARRGGERIFRRDVTIDGYELPGGDLHLTAQLCDLLFAPAPPLAQPMDRFARQHELRVQAVAALFRKLDLVALDAWERRRERATFTSAPWVTRGERVAPLVGRALSGGITRAIIDEFGPTPDDAPLRDALLQLAPATIQCFAALDLWSLRIEDTGAADTGGYPDSCYIWRRDGHLGRWRADAERQTRS
jgi:hypothetical protein